MMEAVAMLSRPGRVLFGSDYELSRLSELVAIDPVRSPDVEASVGVVVDGDAGVGKTRLLEELRANAEVRGWRVVTGHCIDFGEAHPPYLPFAELFGRLASDWPALTSSLL